MSCSCSYGRLYLLHLKLVEVVVETFEHTVEGYFCRVWNEGEDGVLHIVVDGLEYGRDE